MTIIRVNKREKYCIVHKNIIDDNRISSKYLGVYLRLISKNDDWNISIKGLAALYPTEGVDFYRAALKHFCKYGYLIRVPSPRNKGQFQKVTMELFEECQFDEPLSDEDVDSFFSKEILTLEEIQKMFPERIFRLGSSDSVKPMQLNTDILNTEKTDYNLLPPSTKILDSPVLSVPVVVCPFLDQLDLDHECKMRLSRDHPPEKLKVAVERVLAWESRKNDFAAIETVLNRFDNWHEKLDKDFKKLKNERLLENIRQYDGTQINGTLINVGRDYVEFSGGVSYIKVLNINDIDFFSSLISKLQAIGFPEKIIQRLNC